MQAAAPSDSDSARLARTAGEFSRRYWQYVVIGMLALLHVVALRGGSLLAPEAQPGLRDKENVMPRQNVWDQRRNEILNMLRERPHTPDELAAYYGISRRVLMEQLQPLTYTNRIFVVGMGVHPVTYEYNRNYPNV